MITLFFIHTPPSAIDNFKKKSMRKNGFTVIEAMITLAVMAICTLLYVKSTSNTVDLQRAQALRDQTQIYAKLSANYVVQNESQILPLASTTTPIVIPFSQVITSGLTPVGLTATNLLNQLPCISILKNQSGSLEAIMYYVSNSANSKLNEPTIVRAILGLFGIAGEYKNGGVITSSWQILSGSPYYTGANQCVAGYSLTEKNIVVNLNLIPEFNQTIQPDVALHRVKDKTHRTLGTAENKNTSLSDIAFTSNNGLYLNNSSGVELVATGNTLNVQNGDLMASTLQSTQPVASGTACLSSELGKVAMQNDQSSAGVIQSNVTCTFSPLVCGGAGYCYVPVVKNSVTYSNSTNNGALGTSFTCPANLPYLVSATAYQAGNPNATVQTITSSYAGYTMPRGAIANGNSDWNCLSYSFYMNYGSCKVGQSSCTTGTSFNTPGCNGSGGRTYVCGECSSGGDVGDHNGCWGQQCTNWSPPPPVFLSSVTCTSELIIQAN